MTKVPEGKPLFLSPGENDIYSTFKAALAIPGCYPGTVSINGCEYVDGGTINPLPVKGQLDRGMDRIVAILSKPLECESEPPSFLERTLFWRYFQKYDWMLEKLWEAAQAYYREVSFLESLAQGKAARAFIICPEKMLPIKMITRDRKKINQTINLGYGKVEKLEHEICAFLSEAGGQDRSPPVGVFP